MMPQDTNEFHWRDGWMWKRLADGSVRVRKYDDILIHKLELEFVIPPYEWCSIISSVSEHGEQAMWERAKAFHGVL